MNSFEKSPKRTEQPTQTKPQKNPATGFGES